VVWLHFCRCGMCSSITECLGVGVVELSAAARHRLGARGRGAGQLFGAARAPARRAPPRPARSSLCLAVDYFLLDSFRRRDGRIFGPGLDVLAAAGRTCFSKDFAFRRLKTQNFFWPRRGARSHPPELALQTRENRPPAELGEPAERLATCSWSKKSAIYRDYPLNAVSPVGMLFDIA